MKLLFTDLCSVRTMNYEKGLFKIASRGWPDSHSLFLLRQENVSKRRRPHFAALRVPDYASQKMGSAETRYAQTSALLFPFSALHNRQLRSGIPKSKSTSNSNSKPCSR